MSQGYWRDKLTLIYQSIRDNNRCEYGAVTVMIFAPLAAWLRRDGGILRLGIACVTVFLVTAFLDPQAIRARPRRVR